MRVVTALLLGLVSGCAAGGGDGGEGGGAPAGGGGAGGAPACADLSADGDCRHQGPEGGCDSTEVCTIEPFASCGASSCCTLPFVCAAPTGTRPGGYACDADGDCASGLCLQVAGRGICLRPCSATAALDSCPSGLSCATISLDAQRSVRTCVGTADDGSYDAERVLCRGDAGCAPGRICRVHDGEQYEAGRAHGVCEPGTRAGETGTLCVDHGEAPAGVELERHGFAWSSRCEETGFCMRPCEDVDAPACNCSGLGLSSPECRAFVCTKPCERDAECPSPLVCRADERSGLDRLDLDLEFKFCRAPSDEEWDWFCWDQGECCAGGVTRTGGLCCREVGDVCTAPPPDETVCRVTITGDRHQQACALPEGRALLGAACADHAACASGLCAPDGRCTSPCLPASLDQCSRLLPGTQCCPLQVQGACVAACQLDCAGAAGCAP